MRVGRIAKRGISACLALCLAWGIGLPAQAAKGETPVEKVIVNKDEDNGGKLVGAKLKLSGYLPQMTSENWEKESFNFPQSNHINYVAKGSTVTFEKIPGMISTGLQFSILDSYGNEVISPFGTIESPTEPGKAVPSTFIRFGSDVKDFYHAGADLDNVESATGLGVVTTAVREGAPVTLTFDVMTDDYGKTFDFGNPDYVYIIGVAYDHVLANGKTEQGITDYAFAIGNAERTPAPQFQSIVKPQGWAHPLDIGILYTISIDNTGNDKPDTGTYCYLNLVKNDTAKFNIHDVGFFTYSAQANEKKTLDIPLYGTSPDEMRTDGQRLILIKIKSDDERREIEQITGANAVEQKTVEYYRGVNEYFYTFCTGSAELSGWLYQNFGAALS